MMDPCTSVDPLTEETVHSVLTAMADTPSLLSSRPRRLKCLPSTRELHSDDGRHRRAADPDHRKLLLACGAALLNPRLAIQSLVIGADESPPASPKAA